MGSLVPGWDAAAHGMPPRELQDIDEGQELPKGPSKEGYFATLEKSRPLRRASIGADGCYQGALVGTPSHMTKPSLAHSATLPTHSTTSPRTLQHSATTTLARHPTPLRTPYVATDWEAEIHALQSKEGCSLLQEGRPRTSLSRRSADSNVSSHSAHHQPAWWAQLDTGALNQPTMNNHTDAVARIRMHNLEPEHAGGAAHALKGVRLDWVGSNLR